MRKLIHDFQIKEGVKKFIRDLILTLFYLKYLKSAWPWGRKDLSNCIKLLQDTNRIESHQKIYNELFT